MNRTASVTAQSRIADFCNNIIADAHFTNLYARLPRDHDLIRSRKAAEIRTSFHDADAFARDILGNVTVLWSDGRIQQLISDEEIKAAKLYR